jgi:catechol 2,3-dioxygenase-like lactoylglutathione lyase family enzyme
MIDQAFPIISTTDLGRALAFWRDGLGGRVAFEWPGPDGQPVYVGLDLGTSHIGIGLAPDGRRAPVGAIAIWVYTADCDALVERLRDARVAVTAEPEDQPWGERIARVLDPDGNEVILGQRAPLGVEKGD